MYGLSVPLSLSLSLSLSPSPSLFYLAVASERGLEKICELAVAVGYV
jgi:hypothetical protein